jgi:hypothetical protein
MATAAIMSDFSWDGVYKKERETRHWQLESASSAPQASLRSPTFTLTSILLDRRPASFDNILT